MDESSQGSVELIEGVDMVTPHVEKMSGAIREEYLSTPCIDVHRLPGGSPSGTLLAPDLMQTHIHPQMVEEFSAHGEQEYYEHHILHESELSESDRHLVELHQAVVDEPQNLSTPVTVVGEKTVAAMLSAYIQTTGDMTPTHQIIIDSSDRSVKMFQQQRLPSLSSLPPLKKALSNSTIRSRYLRPHTHHSLDEEVTLTRMTNAHPLDGANVIVGHHLVQEDTPEGHRLLTAEPTHTILVEDPMTQKMLQESNQRLIVQENQILVAQDATMSHNLATSNGNHRLGSSLNGHHRMLDVQTDHTTRYITHQEASVVTSMASQRLIAAQAHQTHVQTHAEIDVAERLLDEESPEHQMLVQEQLIHVVLDQNAQAELGVVVPTPGQRVLLQGPEGWTSIDPASCDAETNDHDSRDAAIVEIAESALIVKHEEVDIAENLIEETEGMDGTGDGGADISDGDAAVEDMNDSDFDGEGDMRTSRRSLPHKKRLSKKLRNPRKSSQQPLPQTVHAKCYKCNKCGEQFDTQAAYATHRVTHNPSNKKAPAFSCEICGKIIPNQLKFFEHLKAHYEPGTGAIVMNPSSGNAPVALENGTVHLKGADRNMGSPSIMKDNMQRVQQHVIQPQQQQHQQIPQQHHQQQQQQPQQNHHQQQQHQKQPQQQSQQPQPPQQPQPQQQPQLSMQQLSHQEHPQQASQQQNQRHIQRQLPQPQQPQRPQDDQITQHHNRDVQMVLKVENAQHSHVPQMQQIQSNRVRSTKHEQDNLQNIQHQQRHQQHHLQINRQSHSQQQMSVIDSEPPPLVPILPPVSTITGNVSLTCNLCGKHFRRQKTYETHLSVAHPKQEDIEQFSDPEDMMEGIREVVEAGEDSEGDSESLVRLTTLTPHGADSLPKSHSETWYRDEDLSATEADLQALQHAENEQHIQHHTNQIQQEHIPQQLEITHMCELCGDAFHSKARLNQHLRIEHLELRQKGQKNTAEDENEESPRGKKPLRRLACTQCDRVFNHRNSLVYHLRSHSGERPHQCEECGKSFFATSALKVHMRLHSGDKPYKCDFCGRNFRQWGDLKYHCTSRHSEEKQYQCEYCGKDFARKYSLIVHRRIHTGEKDYVCEFCQKKFRASSYLQNHRRIHTGEKPHRCEVCDKPFRVRSDMKRHLNTHNRDRQRLSGASTSGNTLNGTVRESNHKIEDTDADVDTPDSQDHPAMQNIHLHELENSSSMTVMKNDGEGMAEGMEILPDDGSTHPQSSTTISLSSHTTDEGLQYASTRDPLETRAHSTAHSGQLVYVLPNYYM